MEQREAEVCVVGAGLAGLAAARHLVCAGRTVVLLEARDRVGGRCWNRPVGDGTVLSVGGTWLGAGQDRMFQLCAEAGLDTYAQYDDGDTVLRLDDRNRRYRRLIPSVNPVALASLGVAALIVQETTALRDAFTKATSSAQALNTSDVNAFKKGTAAIGKQISAAGKRANRVLDDAKKRYNTKALKAAQTQDSTCQGLR